MLLSSRNWCHSSSLISTLAHQHTPTATPMSAKSKSNNALAAPAGIAKKSKKSKKSIPSVEAIEYAQVQLDSKSIVWKQMYENLLQTVSDVRTEAACCHAAAQYKYRIPEAEWHSAVASQKQSFLGLSTPQPLLLAMRGRAPRPTPDPDSDDESPPPPPPKSNQKVAKKPKGTKPRSANNHYLHFLNPVLRDSGMPVAGKEGCMAEAAARWKEMSAEDREPFVTMAAKDAESMKSTGARLSEEELRALCPESMRSAYDDAKASLEAKKRGGGGEAAEEPAGEPAEEPAEEAAEEAGAPAAADAMDDDDE